MTARLTADRREALDRLGDKCTSLPTAERAAYLFFCMAILGNNAPDVMHFVLDRADEQLEQADAGRSHTGEEAGDCG